MVSSKQYILNTILVLLSLIGCQTQEPDHTKMVVEGWIDAGKHPIVMLHTSYSMHQNAPHETTFIDLLAEHMVLFGKVVVYDGPDSVILTGRVDTNYLPPYIYTSTQFVGEEGKTYRLKATYKDFSVSSQTTIPEKVHFDSIRIAKSHDRMSIYTYANDLEEGNTYAIFARMTNQSQYQVCPLGAFRANAQQMEIQVRNPLGWDSDDASSLGFRLTFPVCDTAIDIKFAHIEEQEYQIFNTFSSQSLTKGIFFMETYSNIASNIEGGNGYWCGLGATEYTVHLNQDSLYVY